MPLEISAREPPGGTLSRILCRSAVSWRASYFDETGTEHAQCVSGVGYVLQSDRATRFIGSAARRDRVVGVEADGVESLSQHEYIGHEVSPSTHEWDVVASGAGVCLRRRTRLKFRGKTRGAVRSDRGSPVPFVRGRPPRPGPSSWPQRVFYRTRSDRRFLSGTLRHPGGAARWRPRGPRRDVAPILCEDFAGEQDAAEQGYEEDER